MRDFQRSRLYKAEQSVRREYSGLRFKNLTEVQEYLIRLQDSAWFKAQFPEHTTRIRATVNNRSRSWAWGGHGEITLPHRVNGAWAWTEIVVLHEVAHNLTPRPHRAECDGTNPEARAIHNAQAERARRGWGDMNYTCAGSHLVTCSAHGPEFAGIFLNLVDHKQGVFAAQALRQAFTTCKVRVMDTVAAVEEKTPRHKVAVGEVIQSRVVRETGTKVIVTRVEGGWEMKCEDHNTSEVLKGRLDAEAHAAHPSEWCPMCSVNTPE